jgi:hypothetical protein
MKDITAIWEPTTPAKSCQNHGIKYLGKRRCWLQLGIGGRDFHPTANFNTRQNGYDIVADG